MKICITGATGFIGKYLVSTLREIHDLYLLTSRSRFPSSPLYDGTFFISMSDVDLLSAALADCDALVHLAGQRPIKNPRVGFDIYIENLAILERLLEMRSEKRHFRLVNVSTKAVYGNGDINPFHEDRDLTPTTFYGLSKLMAEKLADYYVRVDNLTCVHLRLAQVIGWGDKNRNLFSVCLENAISGEAQEIWGEGSGRRSYVYARDVVSAISAALGCDQSGAYNIAWPDSYSHLQVAQSVGRTFGKGDIILRRDMPEDSSIELMSVTKAYQQLSWQPKFPNMIEGVKDMLNDYSSGAARLLMDQS